MFETHIGRRDLLKLGVFVGTSSILSSCGFVSSRPLISASPEILPQKWRRVLPSPWVYKPLASSLGKHPYKNLIPTKTDLLVLGDGWLSDLPKNLLKPLVSPRLRERLDPQAITFLGGLGDDLASRVLPIGVSPWVLLFRNGEDWIKEAELRWDVLLDDDLKRRVVLPQSPLLIMTIADQMETSDALLKLRGQAIATDDRHAINWLLQGDAKVAVIPLQNFLR